MDSISWCSETMHLSESGRDLACLEFFEVTCHWRECESFVLRYVSIIGHKAGNAHRDMERQDILDHGEQGVTSHMHNVLVVSARRVDGDDNIAFPLHTAIP